MKIRKYISLDILENFGYRYESNLFFPTYQKIKRYGNASIKIEIPICNRIIYINKSKYITKKNIIFIKDLVNNNLIDYEKKS